MGMFFVPIEPHRGVHAIRIILYFFSLWHLRFYSLGNVSVQSCSMQYRFISVNGPSAKKLWFFSVQSRLFFHFHSQNLHHWKTNNQETKYDKLKVNNTSSILIWMWMKHSLTNVNDEQNLWIHEKAELSLYPEKMNLSRLSFWPSTLNTLSWLCALNRDNVVKLLS